MHFIIRFGLFAILLSLLNNFHRKPSFQRGKDTQTLAALYLCPNSNRNIWCKPRKDKREVERIELPWICYQLPEFGCLSLTPSPETNTLTSGAWQGSAHSGRARFIPLRLQTHFLLLYEQKAKCFGHLLNIELLSLIQHCLLFVHL